MKQEKARGDEKTTKAAEQAQPDRDREHGHARDDIGSTAKSQLPTPQLPNVAWELGVEDFGSFWELEVIQLAT
jgi:hypothetical protein